MPLNMYFVMLIGLFVSVQGQRVNSTTSGIPIDLDLEACLKESNASPGEVESLKKGNYNRPNPDLKNFVFCYLVKTGVMSSAGVLRQHVVLKNIADQDQSAVETIINKCLYNKAHDPVDTAWHYLSCFHFEHPQYSKDANRI